MLVDGECLLCDGFARFVAERDAEGVFLFETQQSNAGQQLLKLFDLPLDLKTIVLVEKKAKSEAVYLQSSAVLRILSRLTFPWSAAWCCLAVPPIVRDWLYARVAENRYAWFGKKDACSLPDVAVRARLMRRLND